MYLHLGGDIVVNQKNIIGIFNLEKTSLSKITREYLKKAQKKNVVVSVSDELPASFVICKQKEKVTVYMAQISSVTLSKRAKFFRHIASGG
jgi:hypothetical protein